MTAGTGRLYGVGIGPGDPELVTLKAARLMREADVIAYHQGPGKRSNARRIADPHLVEGVTEEVLEYPVTTGATDHPGGYAGALADFYEECARRLAVHLDAGRTVVILAEGDPLFYGSYMYMHDRLSDRYRTEVVPGITSYAAATAAVQSPLVRQTDVLTVLPGTLPEPELARRLADTQGAIIMKLGRTFPAVVRALAAAGRLDDALYVERASWPEERWLPVRDVDPASVPYFSLIVVPGDAVRSATSDTTSALASSDETSRSLRSDDTPRSLRSDEGASKGPDRPTPRDTTSVLEEARGTRAVSKGPDRPSAELLILGLGPGPDDWLTPEVAAALAEVEHVVGYAPYVNRVPQRAGLQRHASGNTVEVDRARFALDLAARGERVAVVSGGDAGVFGMASAVFEAAEDPAFAGVPIRVLPGVSAVQVVAARAGAPIGADFAVLSLSDRLKPWDVIADRLVALARADLVIAVYNPASRSRTTQVADAQKLLLEHKDPETVVVVGRDIGRAEESLQVTTLGALDPASIDMKCLVLIGASATRRTPDGQVWTPRFVER